MKTSVLSSIAAFLLAICGLGFCGGPALAAEFVFSKVADTDTIIPGLSAGLVFDDFWARGRRIVFEARADAFWPNGIYLFDGDTISRVADTDTPIPGGGGNFTGFGNWLADLQNDAVIFRVDDPGSGIYMFRAGSLRLIVDTTTRAPGGIGNFTSFSEWRIDDDRLLLVGSSYDGAGVYRGGIYQFDGSVLSRIVDTAMPAPGGTGNFKSIGAPEIDGSNVIFRGAHGDHLGGGCYAFTGIYVYDGTAIRTLVDTATPIPGGTGTFTHLSPVRAMRGKLLFHGEGVHGQEGFYLLDGSRISRVADTNTPIPNGTGNFYRMLRADFSGSNVVVWAITRWAQPRSETALYLFDGHSLSRIADLSTPIPNGRGSFKFFEGFATTDNAVVFQGGGKFEQYGLYLFDGHGLRTIIDGPRPISNSEGTLYYNGGFRVTRVRGGGIKVILRGWRRNPNGEGIYVATPAPVQDLATTKLKVPRTVVQGGGPQSVDVEIQNRGDRAEVITLAHLGNGVTTGLVRLAVNRIEAETNVEDCRPAHVVLDAARNAKPFKSGSVALGPAGTLTVHFLVTYDCRSARPPSSGDGTRPNYRHVASVRRSELGAPDSRPDNDVCPRDAVHEPAQGDSEPADGACRAGTVFATNVVRGQDSRR